MKKTFSICLIILLLSLTACKPIKVGYEETWNKIVDSGQNTVVRLVYDNDDNVDNWLEKDLVPTLRQNHNIILKCKKMSTEDIIKNLVEHKDDLENAGEFDVIIFDKTKFPVLKNKGVLYSDYLNLLKNYRQNVSPENLNNTYLGSMEINGLAVSFAEKQMCLFCDENRIIEVPTNMDEFKKCLKDNKGVFTYPHPSTEVGRNFISSIVLSFADEKKLSRKGLSDKELKSTVKPALDYLKEIKPYLFGSGNFHPEKNKDDELDLLFTEGHTQMIISMNPYIAKDKVSEDLYPEFTKSLLPFKSAVSDSTYVGIAYNSNNKSGAMLTINEMLGCDAQLKLFKNKHYLMFPAIDYEMLPKADQERFNKSSAKKTVIKPSTLMKARKHKIYDEYWDYILKEWAKL